MERRDKKLHLTIRALALRQSELRVLWVGGANYQWSWLPPRKGTNWWLVAIERATNEASTLETSTRVVSSHDVLLPWSNFSWRTNVETFLALSESQEYHIISIKTCTLPYVDLEKVSFVCDDTRAVSCDITSTAGVKAISGILLVSVGLVPINVRELCSNIRTWMKMCCAVWDVLTVCGSP